MNIDHTITSHDKLDWFLGTYRFAVRRRLELLVVKRFGGGTTTTKYWGCLRKDAECELGGAFEFGRGFTMAGNPDGNCSDLAGADD